MTKDEKIAKLGKEITDRATVLLGKDKITPESPEYLGINSALKYTAYKYDQKMADDILDICLTMKKRVPLTIEQLAKKNPQFDRAYLEKAMQAVSESGLVEFHWENLDGKNPNHEKRWVLDMFVPGSAEIMMINPEQSDMYPETADFFERMAYLPLAGITEMVPPGGAGIGMCDDRVTFTEEQIKSEASRCLSCGRSVVDPNKCIGCGICTTKCEFDAIHLKRNRPQNSKMIPAEDKFKAIGPYAAKRQVKIIKKQLSGK